MADIYATVVVVEDVQIAPQPVDANTEFVIVISVSNQTVLLVPEKVNSGEFQSGELNQP